MTVPVYLHLYYHSKYERHMLRIDCACEQNLKFITFTVRPVYSSFPTDCSKAVSLLQFFFIRRSRLSSLS